MDEISELEKYKDLLDSGAITEEEFAQLKQKLLGLKTDEEKEAERQAERAEALKEIDAMREAEKKKAEEAEQQAREEQAEAERRKQEEQAKAEAAQRAQEIQESKEKAAKVYSEEKAKEKARLDAAQEHEDALREEKTQKARSATKAATSVVKSAVLWIVCVFMILFAIGSMTVTLDFYHVAVGIISIVLAAMACPSITSRTKENPALAAYYQFKIPIVIVLVILVLIFMVIAGQ